METQPEDSATVTPPTPTPPTPAVPAADPTTPAPDPTPTPAAAPVRSAPTPSPHPRVGAPLLNIVLVIAGAFAIAGIAFAIGRGTAPSALDQLRVEGPGGQGGQGFPGQGGGRVPLLGTGGGIAVEGTVESIDGDSMTIKTTDGQSIELSLDGETSYHTASDASASAVTNGSKVVVRVQPGRGQQGPGSGGGFDLGADDVTVVP